MEQSELKLVLDKLTNDFEKTLNVLRDLVDIQNGPPLYEYTKDWDEIMNEAYKILEKYNK